MGRRHASSRGRAIRRPRWCGAQSRRAHSRARSGLDATAAARRYAWRDLAPWIAWPAPLDGARSQRWPRPAWPLRSARGAGLDRSAAGARRLPCARARRARSRKDVRLVQHRIPAGTLGPAGAAMARAVETCVHCGFCLPACPTYRVLGEEMDSPRGRIVLMKQVLEGDAALDDALPLHRPLPGVPRLRDGVPVGRALPRLLVPFRAAARRTATTAFERLRRDMLLEHARIARAVPRGGCAPGALAGAGAAPARAAGADAALLPAHLPPPEPLPALVPPGPRRARVALLTGCVQQVLAPVDHRRRAARARGARRRGGGPRASRAAAARWRSTPARAAHARARAGARSRPSRPTSTRSSPPRPAAGRR